MELTTSHAPRTAPPAPALLAPFTSAPRPDVFAALASVTWTLEVPMPHERRDLLLDEASFLVDGLLVRVARGRGALDVALGEGLEALSVGDRVLRLGYSGIGDYAREVLGIEYLGEHPVELREEEVASPLPRHFEDVDLETIKAALEHETQLWAALPEAERFEAASFFPPSPAPGGGEGTGAEASVHLALHARLRELAGMRDRWDALVGHLSLLVTTCGLWRHMGFASMDHYAVERLGMAGRTVQQRVALERRLYWLPGLRTAMRAGRISYEKARVVVAHADDRTVDALIARAERIPCIALRRELEAEEEAQMCTRGDFVLRVPSRVSMLLAAAIAAAREVAGEWLSPGEALARMAEHFVETWKEEVSGRKTRARKVIDRDRGWCQVPGCSKAAVHAHHVVFRSQGGGDEEENLVSLCAAHHLQGIHKGYVRVRGRAPDELEWDGVCSAQA
jgi:hypothetical protein